MLLSDPQNIGIKCNLDPFTTSSTTFWLALESQKQISLFYTVAVMMPSNTKHLFKKQDFTLAQ